MNKADVIVIGAGMAGLSAAIDMAADGLDVVVLERAGHPGGKMREVNVGGVKLDAGPTVFTMRWVFDALLGKAGTSLENEVGLKTASVLARHVWDGDPDNIFDLHADQERSTLEIAQRFSSEDAAGYRAFCAEAKRIFDTLKDPYMAAQRPGFFELPMRVGLSNLPQLAATKPFASMWSGLSKHFKDERLRQLFGRYATYCGSSPYQAAATLMLVAHVEQDGVWLVDGGMHKLALALKNVAERMGVRFVFNEGVSKIGTQHGEVERVITSSGTHWKTKAVVCNSDVAAIATGLLGPMVQRAVPKMEATHRSLSAITWQVNARARGFPLTRHNVFFSKDYRAEFDALFRQGRVPSEPTTYICAQDRDDLGNGPDGRAERMLVLINAPATGDARDFPVNELRHYEEKTFRLLERCGLEIDRADADMKVTSPAGFDALFPATGGALYGRASHGWLASFQRPAARTKIPGLYLAGGSAHPGPGVPMAALSGRLAAESIMKDMPGTKARRTASPIMEAAQ